MNERMYVCMYVVGAFSAAGWQREKGREHLFAWSWSSARTRGARRPRRNRRAPGDYADRASRPGVPVGRGGPACARWRLARGRPAAAAAALRLDFCPLPVPLPADAGACLLPP